MSVLPRGIQIGPLRYTVGTTAEGTHGEAYIDYYSLTITVNPQMAYDRAAEALMHEVMHGILRGSGALRLVKKRDEHVLDLIAPMLLDTLRRNPDLVAYLIGGPDDLSQVDRCGQSTSMTGGPLTSLR